MKLQKKCVDCIYYIGSHIKEHSDCLKFGTKKPFIFEKAEKMREDITKCGPDAKSFISKYLK